MNDRNNYQSNGYLYGKLHDHLHLVENHFPKNEVFYLGLYGSQNYNLNTPASDVDTKCIVLPTCRQMILNRPRVNNDIINGDDGAICNAKDIAEMFRNFYKGNINFVEILFTRWYLVPDAFQEEAKELRKNKEMIATRDIPNLLRMVAGMARQKYFAFDKQFESKKEILEKYGYDPKQLFHILRLYCFLQDFSVTCNFEKSLIPTNEVREILLNFKTHPPKLSKAKDLRDSYMGKIDDSVKELTPKFKLATWQQDVKDDYVKDFLDDLAVRVITKNLRNDFLH